MQGTASRKGIPNPKLSSFHKNLGILSYQSSGAEMASSNTNSGDLNNLSTPDLISFIRTRAFMESQFEEVAKIIYSREQIADAELRRLNLANIKAEGRCSALESQCTHLRSLYLEEVSNRHRDPLQKLKCANLINQSPNVESGSSHCTKIMELEGKLKEKDRSVLLDAKYREMEDAKSVAESRCRILESECALFQNRCTDLEKKIQEGPSNTGLCSMITELQNNLKGEKDRFRLLEQKYQELERFSFGIEEEADKYKKMSDQLQEHVENVEKELSLLRAKLQQGQEEIHQWKLKFSELEIRVLKSFDENVNLKANLERDKVTLSSGEKELDLLRARNQLEQEEFHKLKCKCSKLEVQVLKLFDENLELQTNLKKEIHDSAKLQLIPVKEENNLEVYGPVGNGSSTQFMIPHQRNAVSGAIIAVNSAPMEEEFSNTSAMLEGPIAKLDPMGESEATKKSQDLDDPNVKIALFYGRKL